MHISTNDHQALVPNIEELCVRGASYARRIVGRAPDTQTLCLKGVSKALDGPLWRHVCFYYCRTCDLLLQYQIARGPGGHP
jgi:hypothetical protein